MTLYTILLPSAEALALPMRPMAHSTSGVMRSDLIILVLRPIVAASSLAFITEETLMLNMSERKNFFIRQSAKVVKCERGIMSL